MRLDVHSLPQLTTPEALAGSTVVVIDVLRATTTMLYALQAGARCVIPCLEVDEALRIAAGSPGNSVLGGERHGVRIEGFQLGNSPSEYTPSTVGGKCVVLTTTNGTQALRVCRQAARVLVGAFVNRSCLVAALARAERIALLCAGTDGHITQEDVLFAGAVVAELERTGVRCAFNDEAELAAAAWQATSSAADPRANLQSVLRRSRGGRNLVRLGFGADIELAAQLDSTPVLGELSLQTWRVVRV